jgi:hypothetical protein
MGLLKTIPTKYGTPAEYFRLAAVTIDTRARLVTCTLEGYTSQQARTAGALPIIARDYAFSGDNYPVTIESQVLISDIYQAVKTRDSELTDAENV